jgi:hypothetical protein
MKNTFKTIKTLVQGDWFILILFNGYYKLQGKTGFTEVGRYYKNLIR